MVDGACYRALDGADDSRATDPTPPDQRICLRRAFFRHVLLHGVANQGASGRAPPAAGPSFRPGPVARPHPDRENPDRAVLPTVLRRPSSSRADDLCPFLCAGGDKSAALLAHQYRPVRRQHRLVSWSSHRNPRGLWIAAVAPPRFDGATTASWRNCRENSRAHGRTCANTVRPHFSPAETPSPSVDRDTDARYPDIAFPDPRGRPLCGA